MNEDDQQYDRGDGFFHETSRDLLRRTAARRVRLQPSGFDEAEVFFSHPVPRKASRFSDSPRRLLWETTGVPPGRDRSSLANESNSRGCRGLARMGWPRDESKRGIVARERLDHSGGFSLSSLYFVADLRLLRPTLNFVPFVTSW